MRRIVLVLLPLLAGFTPQQKTDRTDLPDITAAAQSSEPVPPAAGRFSLTIACGPGGPWTLRGWWNEADTIVRVRIDSQAAYDELHEASDDPWIMTALEATVLEAFKPHPHAATGSTMPITHPGGTLMRSDGLETHQTNGFPPPANGTEWFLFLSWREDEQRFWITYLEDGALQVVDGKLVALEGASLSTRWRAGMDAEAFAEQLRRAAR
jgi:hypothetical protein